MKKILLIFILFWHQVAFAQKEDATWLLGYVGDKFPIDTLGKFGVMLLDLNETPFPLINIIPKANVDYDTNLCMINNSEGSPIISFDGHDVYNKFFLPMKGSDSLNYTAPQNSLVLIQKYISQSSILIPYPKQINKYILLHQQAEYVVDKGFVVDVRGERLLYSVIDMNEEGGIGKVTERKTIIIEKPLDLGKLTAVRHANGEDWWLIQKNYDKPIYYKILVTSDGIKFIDEQTIGIDDYSGLGQAVFSPDGKYYINMDCNTGVKTNCTVFDFDRCTGKFYNPRNIKHNLNDIWSGGVAISPNSRYLYLVFYEYIYQYDLFDSDFEKSKKQIAKYDGFKDTTNNFPTRFNIAQLAVDGKIYISCSNSVQYLHVIHNPNLKGDSCNVEQHGVKLPTYNAFGLPNYPNFKLGKADTQCITSSEEMEDRKEKIKIYPNPASDNITIKTNLKDAVLIVKGFDGKILSSTNFYGQTIFSLQNISNGIIFCEIWSEGKKVATEKVAIIH
jgi:hypothetical protein